MNSSCLLTIISAITFLQSQISAEPGWFAFTPPNQLPEMSAIDLRFLNERVAGENGFIAARDGQFVNAANGKPIRFWAVNGPPQELDEAELKRTARWLAAYGVNLVRIHTPIFNQDGEPDARKIARTHAIVQAMKAEGIYTHLSIYFPLWLTPKPGAAWLEGYDGKQHPFAALFFNPSFQAKYRAWWAALLTQPDPATGKPLVDEPAVAGLEIQNEDSFFFWTFAEKNLPDPQLRMLEKQFGDWLIERHGSLEKALEKWGGQRLKRDQPSEGRVAFRPLWNMFNEKTARDRETARFLFETQKRFYAETYAFLKSLGVKSLITASNWATASPEVFGPLEKLSYTTGDFIDRHGYFSCNHKGENAAWSIRNGHTFNDRSALRFEADDPTKPRLFAHPALDPQYDDKPSMISETTWTRPNRFRSEAPLYLAVYGALQDTDAIVHFALDGATWAVKPRFWMQPWTLLSPAMMGQFPAAALLYRQGLVATGEVVAEVTLSQEDLLALKGTPLPQDAALDELRFQDVPVVEEIKPGQHLDPLLHYAGQARVRFARGEGGVKLRDLRSLVDRSRKTVVSSHRQLKLDYGAGLLVIDAPQAQGASGNVRSGGEIDTHDLTISSELDLIHIVAVAMDGKPLASSGRILLQVMTEEKTSDFKTADVAALTKRIENIGVDPWQVREAQGTVQFKRSDALKLQVSRLDLAGNRVEKAGHAGEIKLHPATLYYLIERTP